jgi:hypothetical protein
MSPTTWLVWAFLISAVSFCSGYQLARYFDRDWVERVGVALRRTREALAAARAEAEVAQQWVSWLIAEVAAMKREEREVTRPRARVVKT